MKTLDEVINALEICGHDESAKCPYFDTEHWCCCEDHMRSISPLKNDALHYLKTIETTENLYHDAVNELSKWKDDDWKDRCLPLTWDELRQMEDKPVWVEFLNDEGEWNGEWCLVESSNNILCEILRCKMSWWGLRKITLDKTWEAYRKERS